MDSDYSSSIAIDIKPKGSHKAYRYIRFIGAMDKAGLTEVRGQIEEVVEGIDEEQCVVFNFKDLEFINSESIGFLLMIHTRLVKKQKRLVVVDAIVHVKDVLDTIGVLKIIDYYPTIEEFESSL